MKARDDQRDVDRYEWPIIAHADVAEVDCGGCIWPVKRDDQADIVCNECGSVVRTVRWLTLANIPDEIELSLKAASTEMCRFCGRVNIFPGWSTMMVYTCRHCGKVVTISEDRESL